MVRVKSVLVLLGTVLAVSTLGCQEQQLKSKITLLEGEKSRLNAALTEREAFALLDSVFLDSVPVAPPLLQLLEARGWTGWTKLERIDPPRR